MARPSISVKGCFCCGGPCCLEIRARENDFDCQVVLTAPGCDNSPFIVPLTLVWDISNGLWTAQIEDFIPEMCESFIQVDLQCFTEGTPNWRFLITYFIDACEGAACTYGPGSLAVLLTSNDCAFPVTLEGSTSDEFSDLTLTVQAIEEETP